jgi:diamine N-acetyltransferase
MEKIFRRLILIPPVPILLWLVKVIMIQIKTAGTSDICTIRDLAERTWWPTYSALLHKAQIEYMLGAIYSQATILNAMTSGSQTFMLLSENEIPKGFASYGSWTEQQNTWKIHKLYVLPECHGKGFGRMLLDEINVRAKSDNIETIVLNVKRDNPAYHFYIKYGFAVLREEDIPMGPYWMNDYIMTIPVH